MESMNHALPKMICPRDGGALLEIDRRGVDASHCGGCRGLWIPKVQLVRKLDASLIRKLYHVPAKQMAGLRCPQDNAPLWEFSADGVLLDRCNACGGLWFDAGELETVMGKIRFTTSPTAALNGSKALDAHTGSFNSSSMSGADVAFEIVAGLLEWLAAGLR